MRGIYLPLFLTVTLSLVGQVAPNVQAKKIDAKITVDGLLDEAFWQNAGTATDFVQYFPNDSVDAALETEVKLAYDDDFLYVGVVAQSAGPNYVISSLQRDFRGTQNDNVTLMFDTFKDGNIAFAFGVTPYGVQREVLVSGGGAQISGFNTSWDVKWTAEAKRYDDHYVVEMAIPFYSLKFIEGDNTWRFRAYRFDIQSNERSTWVRVPQNQLLSNLAYMGTLEFEEPLGKPAFPFSFIPYAAYAGVRDEGATNLTGVRNIGLDVKVPIGDALNMDLTINPDFSSAEADDLQTNLTRFELRLPEKRQFFIDNSDLFGSFGNYFNEARPFFSRRIGLATDTAGNLVQNRILGGARLSGKLDENWRLGVLDIQTAASPEQGIAGYNNSMVAIQRKLFARDNIGAFIVNRQLTSGDTSATPYNRVIGADYNLASADNTWAGKFYWHKSFIEDNPDATSSAQAVLTRNSRKWVFVSDFVKVDQDFQADLGFVPRTDFFKMGLAATRHFYPDNKYISRHSLMLLNINYWKPTLDWRYTDHTNWLEHQIYFKDQSRLRSRALDNYIYLFGEFDPTRTEGATPLPADVGYRFYQYNGEYTSNTANLLTYRINTTMGQFFNGQRYSIGGRIGYRWQPWVSTSINVNYDGIRLPEPYASANLWLITPRINVTFSKSVFWSTLIQYSNQQDNFGINSRLQWRFAPLSDLFIVYNDNYYSSDFAPRLRTINLKLSYWLNTK